MIEGSLRQERFEALHEGKKPGRDQTCGLLVNGNLASLASSFAPPLCLKLSRRQLATLEKKDFERLSWPVCGVIGHLEIGAEA